MAAAAPRRGPRERADRGAVAATPAELAAVLDAALDLVDAGMLSVDGDGEVMHRNAAARDELDSMHPVWLEDGALRTRDPRDRERLHGALAAARDGQRMLAVVGGRATRVALAVLPLGAAAGGATLVMLGRRARGAPHAAVDAVARAADLTVAETRVLLALAGGQAPREIADSHGVGLTTVRSQLAAIRTKTGTRSLRELVHLLATLPPVRRAR